MKGSKAGLLETRPKPCRNGCWGLNSCWLLVRLLFWGLSGSGVLTHVRLAYIVLLDKMNIEMEEHKKRHQTSLCEPGLSMYKYIYTVCLLIIGKPGRWEERERTGGREGWRLTVAGLSWYKNVEIIGYVGSAGTCSQHHRAKCLWKRLFVVMYIIVL